jgi:hypothetical protein
MNYTLKTAILVAFLEIILYNCFMESIGKIAKFQQKSPSKQKPSKHLHSPVHLLADELSKKLNDTKHFAFYLKMAVLYDHNYLRNLAGQIMESKTVQTPGRLFAYLIKKNNQEKKSRQVAGS